MAIDGLVIHSFVIYNEVEQHSLRANKFVEAVFLVAEFNTGRYMERKLRVVKNT